MVRNGLFRKTIHRIRDPKKAKLRDELRAKNIDILTPNLLLSALNTAETRGLHTQLMKKIDKSRQGKEDNLSRTTFKKLSVNPSDRAKELVAFALAACAKLENTKAMEQVKDVNVELHAQGLSKQINRISLAGSIATVLSGATVGIALLGAGFSDVVSGFGGFAAAAVIFTTTLYVTNKLDLKTRDLYVGRYDLSPVKQI